MKGGTFEVPEDVGRWRKALGELAEEAGPSEECPEPERLWNVALGELEPIEAREVVEHLAGCAHCGEALRLAQELRRQVTAEGAEEQRAGSSPERRRRPGGTSLLAVAAGLVAVVLGSLWFIQRGPSREGAELREPGRRLLSSLLEEGEALPRDNFLLRWSVDEEGAVYSILVSDQELEVVSRAEMLEEPEYLVPGSDLSSLDDGAVVLWQVSSRRLDGSRSSSTTFLARLE